MAENTRIFSVANRKGGTGKSTATMLLAGALAQRSARVLVVDADAQGSINATFELENRMYDGTPPLFDVLPCVPADVLNTLRERAAAYDFVFLDVPRVTELRTDVVLGQMIALCDGVLVPVLGSQLDAMSTLDFVRVLHKVGEGLEKQGREFLYFGFINRASRRSENRQTADVLAAAGLPFFDEALADLKVFASPSTRESVISVPRFAPFFNEFLAKFNI